MEESLVVLNVLMSEPLVLFLLVVMGLLLTHMVLVLLLEGE